jgi:hypothetical protein
MMTQEDRELLLKQILGFAREVTVVPGERVAIIMATAYIAGAEIIADAIADATEEITETMDPPAED